MTEITDADRDAAAQCAVLVEMRELIRAGKADHHAEPWAKHREYGYNTGYYDGRTASTAALSKRVEELEAVWSWFASHTQLELSFDGFEDDVWQVHAVHGGRNDREWTKVAEGETPLAAIMAAKAALGGDHA